MISPLRRYQPPHEQGVFGAVRKHDVHTGVDLYCDPGEPVYAMESGKVVYVASFTGPDVGSPWWHATKAVVVSGPSGYIVYGEVHPIVREGDPVYAGQKIAVVATVLRKDKGLPMTMLHVELYETFTGFVDWFHGDPQPSGLLDPTPLLNAAGIKWHNP